MRRLVLVLLASRGRAGAAGSGLTPVFLQGPEHWEEVFAVLGGGVLSLFKDRAAAEQVGRSTSGLSWCSRTSVLPVVFPQNISRWPPIQAGGSLCKENLHYRRKENTFRLTSVSLSQP